MYFYMAAEGLSRFSRPWHDHGTGQFVADTAFSQMNLTSDVPGMAQDTDSNLKNPWGVSFAPTSPFGVSNQVSGNSTLYNGDGTMVPLVVSTPPGKPTGQVFNGTGQVLEPGGTYCIFHFCHTGGHSRRLEHEQRHDGRYARDEDGCCLYRPRIGE